LADSAIASSNSSILDIAKASELRLTRQEPNPNRKLPAYAVPSPKRDRSRIPLGVLPANQARTQT